MAAPFEIFLVAPPGLEPQLLAEARALGLPQPQAVPGGVTLIGGWPEVWRANLMCRGATRVLARVARFRALHLAQLDKRARKVDWAAFLRPDRPVRVEATCRKSRIYHGGAAAQRVARAIAETVGAPVAEAAGVVLKVRIEDDLCTISIDTSGESLHKRGHKPAVGKAPLRETLAALFLEAAGYDGAMPVVDPMCGSGTFVVEAAEIAAGLAPGRSRSFAFEELASFDAAAWAALPRPVPAPAPGAAPAHCFGFDRDTGAIATARANATAAGLSDACHFAAQPISALAPPAVAPGLVIVNPPYGARIGSKKALYALYGSLGARLLDGFAGWRVGIVTSEPALARTTGLPFAEEGPPVPHGSLKIRLYRCDPL